MRCAIIASVALIPRFATAQDAPSDSACNDPAFQEQVMTALQGSLTGASDSDTLLALSDEVRARCGAGHVVLDIMALMAGMRLLLDDEPDRAIEVMTAALPAMQANPETDPQVLALMSVFIGAAHMGTGDVASASPLIEDAFRRTEETYGMNSLETGQMLSILAMLRAEEGRDVEAMELHNRAMEVLEQQGEPANTHVGAMLKVPKDGVMRRSQMADFDGLLAGFLDEVDILPPEILSSPMLRQIVPMMVLIKGQRAMEEDDYTGAEAQFLKALRLRRPNDFANSLPDRMMVLMLARARMKAGRAARALEATALVEQNGTGPAGAHARLPAQVAIVRAEIFREQRRMAEALEAIRAGIVTAEDAQLSDGAPLIDGMSVRGDAPRRLFEIQADLARIAAARARPRHRAALLEESFRAAQQARTTEAAGSILRLTARLDVRDGALKRRMREVQDAVRQREALRQREARLIAESAALPEREALRRELSALDSRIAQGVAALRTEFPDYARLTGQAPVMVAQIQAVLAPDEAVVMTLGTEEALLIYAIRRNNVEIVRSPRSRDEVEKMVDRVRAGLVLDPDGPLPAFPLGMAHRLHDAVFAPVRQGVAGARTVIWIGDGALASVPPGIFLASPPAAPGRIDAYGHLSWLQKRHAFITAPSAGAFLHLRARRGRAGGHKPLLGIGAPDMTRGPFSTLGALPETREELASIREILGGGQLVTGRNASETMLRRASDSGGLTRYRVVVFATHALPPDAGGTDGSAGLVLTHPGDGATDAQDDGFLTAFEVSRLRLDAEMVVLSACDTAAGSRGNRQPLGGLVASFFHAGARSVVASHWRVPSRETARLTGRMMQASTDEGMPLHEALRTASLDIMQGGGRAAHPAFWGAFAAVSG